MGWRAQRCLAPSALGLRWRQRPPGRFDPRRVPAGSRGPGAECGLIPTAILAVVIAGFLAGAINAVVGSGSLITFPVLLAVGFPPVTANVSNSLGLAFGNVSAVVGYRREL